MSTKIPLFYSVRLRNRKAYSQLNTKIINGVDDLLYEPNKRERDAWIRTLTKKGK